MAVYVVCIIRQPDRDCGNRQNVQHSDSKRVLLESQRNAEAHAARLHLNGRQRQETWLKGTMQLHCWGGGRGVAVDFCAIKCHQHQRCAYTQHNIPSVPLNVQGNARAIYVIYKCFKQAQDSQQ